MSSAAGNGEGSSNRMSMMARGMVPYVATEKDCMDEDGNEAECVICFEEFEAGDKMARLVCWCKFHEVSLHSLFCLLLVCVDTMNGKGNADDVHRRA